MREARLRWTQTTTRVYLRRTLHLFRLTPVDVSGPRPTGTLRDMAPQVQILIEKRNPRLP